ncbi:MAG: D-alanine--D-alanine ligase [Acidobacteria bacterium]|nr:D-alanine--D-alanine ligase [Acidobacteriota bacterium]
MPPHDQRIQLYVLFGGRSAEHDVSCVTARHVVEAVDRSRYDVTPVGITRDGAFVLAEGAVELMAQAAELPAQLSASGPSFDLLPRAQADDGQVVVLPLLHGPLGEDGAAQGLLEMAGVPYVGAGVLGSALAMDKAKAKQLLGLLGVPQAKFLAMRDTQIDSRSLDRVVEHLGFPIFVKPANMGSSIGVSKAHDRDELSAAVTEAASFDRWVVFEETIVGREIEIASLGNDTIEYSVPGEVRPGNEFYDYEDKYVDGNAEIIIPAELEPTTLAEILRISDIAIEALRVEGMARVDFLVETNADGSEGRVLLNEVNTIPGFTPISQFPRLWAASGVSYSDLIDRLVDLAIERHKMSPHRTDRN